MNGSSARRGRAVTRQALGTTAQTAARRERSRRKSRRSTMDGVGDGIGCRSSSVGLNMRGVRDASSSRAVARAHARTSARRAGSFKHGTRTRGGLVASASRIRSTIHSHRTCAGPSPPHSCCRSSCRSSARRRRAPRCSPIRRRCQRCTARRSRSMRAEDDSWCSAAGRRPTGSRARGSGTGNGGISRPIRRRAHSCAVRTRWRSIRRSAESICSAAPSRLASRDCATRGHSTAGAGRASRIPCARPIVCATRAWCTTRARDGCSWPTGRRSATTARARCGSGISSGGSGCW